MSSALHQVLLLYTKADSSLLLTVAKHLQQAELLKPLQTALEWAESICSAYEAPVVGSCSSAAGTSTVHKADDHVSHGFADADDYWLARDRWRLAYILLQVVTVIGVIWPGGFATVVALCTTWSVWHCRSRELPRTYLNLVCVLAIPDVNIVQG